MRHLRQAMHGPSVCSAMTSDARLNDRDSDSIETDSVVEDDVLISCARQPAA